MITIYDKGTITLVLGFVNRLNLVRGLEREGYVMQGTDPGISAGEGANPRWEGGRSPTYDFAKFSQKLHEIENILGCQGMCTRGAIRSYLTQFEFSKRKTLK